MTTRARKRTREEPELRRAEILQAACGILGERGYYGLTLQALSQRCGLTNAGLLHHFGSKDHLLLAVLEDFERREIAAMTPIVGGAMRQMEQHGNAPDVLRGLLRTMVARATREPELARLFVVLQAESLHAGHPAHDMFRRRETATVDFFARLLAPYAGTPRETARRLLAVMDGLVIQWLRNPRHVDLLAEMDAAFTMLAGRTRGQSRQRRKT